MTQELRVLKHLQEYGSITSWEAIEEYGATRLSAIIYNLRKKGFKIKTDFVSKKNRHGDVVVFGKYILEEQKWI